MSDEATPVLVPPGVMGYTDEISYRPGDTVRLAVSTTAGEWTARLVRLHALSIPSAGVPRRESPVPSVAAVTCPGIDQVTDIGSYVRVDGVPAMGADGLTVAVALLPTRPGDDAQDALSHGDARAGGGWALGLDDGGRIRLTVATAGGPVVLVAGPTVVDACWYEVRATITADHATLVVEQAGTFESNRVVRAAAGPWTAAVNLTDVVPAGDVPLLWGCGGLVDDRSPVRPFDGRVENPVLVADVVTTFSRHELMTHPAIVAAWDLAAGIGLRGIAATSHVADLSGRHDGRAVNHPQRAVTASSWDGDVADFRHAPRSYAAIHFHRDDVTDCRWEPQAAFTLPTDLPSGVYALDVTDTAGARDTVPVFVTPARGTATAPILLVLPTNSYLAYGNDHVGVDSPRTQMWSQMVPTLDDFELFRDTRRELGYSLYEAHRDGTGVCYSSWRRPLLTLRERVYDHNAPVWQFTGDMQIVDWLDRTGHAVDIVTDHDLHAGGRELLERYRLVITGTHPEYPTREMLQAYEEYVAGGGRLIYTGGNGMYWVTAQDPEDPQVVEIRRWGATQAWLAAPGEYHLGFSGHLGGIWRFNGRPPQKTFGVGFVAAGNPGASAGYRRITDDPAVAWVFAGVDVRDFGSYGVSRGAAGIEIDAVNPLMGTSDRAVVLATSVGHNDDMLEARENFNMTSRVLGGGRNPKVHADLVLVPRENGGAVFSTGSIAFSGALYDIDGHQEVSRLFGNVVDRFVSGDPVVDQPI